MCYNIQDKEMGGVMMNENNINKENDTAFPEEKGAVDTFDGENKEVKEDIKNTEESKNIEDNKINEDTEASESCEPFDSGEINDDIQMDETGEGAESMDNTDGEFNNEESSAETDDAADNADDKKSNEQGGFVRFLYETVEMMGIAIAIVILIITFGIRYSPVHGSSMTYTINEKDNLLVQIAFYEPKRNDIVILQAPDYDLNKPLIKRVIAIGGDELFINFETWEVFVNGEKIDEYYVRYNPFEPNPELDEITEPMDHQSIYKIPEGRYDEKTNTFTATVPEGKVFVMGDNRNNSHDSRSANVGFVDERCIIGRAFFRLTPFSDMGLLK